MKLAFRHIVVGIAALSCSLSGCGLNQHPSYSAGMKYPLRKDPVLISTKVKDLGEEPYDPDRPGVLPIMKIEDIYKPDHPYYKGIRILLAPNLKKLIADPNFDQLAVEKRNELEDRALRGHAQHHQEFVEVLDKTMRDPTQVSEADRQVFLRELEAKFGTPAAPTVNVEKVGAKPSEQTELDDAIRDLKLDPATLAMGSTRYRIHCVHCHGVPGDGRGPTARWINPHPRDFRAARFKFQSVDRTAKTEKPPSRADLLRTLRQGIEGTAMPTFSLLKDEELEAIASYVIHLSIRGRVEYDTLEYGFEWAKDNNASAFRKKEPIEDNVKTYTALRLKQWAASNTPAAEIDVIEYPHDYPTDPNDPGYLKKMQASVKRGQQIFNATPSEEFKKEFRDRILPTEIADAKLAELDKALAKVIAERDEKAYEAFEAKAVAAAETKALADKKKLTEDDIAKIKEEAQSKFPAFASKEDAMKDALAAEIKAAEVKGQGRQKAIAKIKDEYRAKLHALRKAEVGTAFTKIAASVEKEYPRIENDVSVKVDAKVLAVLASSKCVTCHTDYGRQAKYKWDEWGTLVRPNNLAQGGLRGGKRPVDIYQRIHSGIPGSEMTPFGATFIGNEQYMWDLVNFITVLPYPAMRESLKLKID